MYSQSIYKHFVVLVINTDFNDITGDPSVDIAMDEPPDMRTDTGNHTNNVGNNHCILCKYNGCSGKVGRVIDEITIYIEEKLNNVHVDEMARQILIVLQNELSSEIDENLDRMTESAIVNHIRNHITKPKAIFYELLQDLRGMAKTAKQASVYKCEETGQTSIDVKVFNTYLKTVDTICSICKSDAMKNIPKS